MAVQAGDSSTAPKIMVVKRSATIENSTSAAMIEHQPVHRQTKPRSPLLTSRQSLAGLKPRVAGRTYSEQGCG